MGFAKQIVVIVGSLVFTVHCRSTEKSSGDAKPVSDGIVASCIALVNGNPYRCTEYPANLSSAIKDAARSVCGDESKGMKGWTWKSMACPTASILGDCVTNDGTSPLYSHDYFYANNSTLSQAQSNCSQLGGTLKKL